MVGGVVLIRFTRSWRARLRVSASLFRHSSHYLWQPPMRGRLFGMYERHTQQVINFTLSFLNRLSRRYRFFAHRLGLLRRFWLTFGCGLRRGDGLGDGLGSIRRLRFGLRLRR